MAAAEHPGLFRLLVLFEPIVYPTDRPPRPRSAEPAARRRPPAAAGVRLVRGGDRQLRVQAADGGLRPRRPRRLRAPRLPPRGRPDPPEVRARTPRPTRSTRAASTRPGTASARSTCPVVVVAGRIETEMQPSAVAEAIADRAAPRALRARRRSSTTSARSPTRPTIADARSPTTTSAVRCDTPVVRWSAWFEVPTSLSPSRVEKFMSCPLAFRFARIEKLPERPTIHTTRGSLVHRALELAYARPAPAAHAGRLPRRRWPSARDEFRSSDFVALGLDDEQRADARRRVPRARRALPRRWRTRPPSGRSGSSCGWRRRSARSRCAASSTASS